MIEYKGLSKKAKEILEEGFINISISELKEEFRLINESGIKLKSDAICNYDPNVIYMITQQNLVLKNPFLTRNENMLVAQADELFPKRLMQAVLIGINLECDRRGIDIDDYKLRARLADRLLENAPIAYYPNIIEFINNEEYSDCKFRGLSIPFIIDKCFPKIENIINDARTDREKRWINQEILEIIFRFISKWKLTDYSPEYIDKVINSNLCSSFYLRNI